MDEVVGEPVDEDEAIDEAGMTLLGGNEASMLVNDLAFPSLDPSSELSPTLVPRSAMVPAPAIVSGLIVEFAGGAGPEGTVAAAAARAQPVSLASSSIKTLNTRLTLLGDDGSKTSLFQYSCDLCCFLLSLSVGSVYTALELLAQAPSTKVAKWLQILIT